MSLQLVLSYGLDEYMDMYRPTPATADDLSKFHQPEYIEWLSKVRRRYLS